MTYSCLLAVLSLIFLVMTRINHPILTGCCPLDHRDGIPTNYDHLALVSAVNSACNNIHESWNPEIYSNNDENLTTNKDADNPAYDGTLRFEADPQWIHQIHKA